MTRQMEKAVYEAPQTERFQVELEGVFCGSIYEDQKHQEGVTSNAQEYETFDGANGFVQNDNGGINWQ